MSTDEPYELVKVLGPGLVGLRHPKHGYNLWTIGKVRSRDKQCCVCGGTIKRGGDAFLPISFGYNRMDRICPLCVQAWRNLQEGSDDSS